MKGPHPLIRLRSSEFLGLTGSKQVLAGRLSVSSHLSAGCAHSPVRVWADLISVQRHPPSPPFMLFTWIYATAI
jgi:hypothetical protein